MSLAMQGMNSMGGMGGGLGGSFSFDNIKRGMQSSAMSDPLSPGNQSMGGQLGASGGMDTMFGINKNNQNLSNMFGGMGSMGSYGGGW